MSNIVIITGESSGELYGALLANEIKRLFPQVKLWGVGGKRMQEAGVSLISHITSALGAFEVITSLRRLKITLNKTISFINEMRPELVILIDYPDFNLRVAREAKRLGIKILYYVSPQVWAWRKKRVKIIAELVDKMAVLLPFERAIYEEAGLECEFVGHPVMEEIENISKEGARKELGIKEKERIIALLPGSRHNELKRHLPIFIESVKKIKAEFQEFNFALPLAPNLDSSKYEGQLNELRKLGVRIIDGKPLEVLSVSELAVVASGTASFQAAMIGLPIVVIYRLNALSYILGRILIDVKYITLINLILNRAVIPELIQSRATPENIFMEIKRILNDHQYRQSMIEAFKEVRAIYEGLRPSKRVAMIAGEMAGLL